MRFLIPVVTSAESGARDAAAISDGIPSRALMQRAGAAAAGEIALRYRDRLDAGVLVLAGPGNNGGDAWVVAAALCVAGASVRVVEPIVSKTSDAQAERAVSLRMLDAEKVETGRRSTSIDHGEALVVDGLLGTGASGAPRDEIAAAIESVNAMRARGAVVVALDVPSGLDASTGVKAGAAVTADLTLTFAAIKRGHLIDRDACGTVVVLDIGIGANVPVDEGMPRLVDERWVASQIPTMAANAHKGTRKKIAIVGGARGMAGAPMLAARAALRSGAGMVKLVVAAESVPVIQEAEPYALAAEWPGDDLAVDEQIMKWADAVVIGPGLGRTDESRALLERVLRCWRGPTLLDADAITIFEGRAADLASALGGRAALLTPHPVEFARLAGSSAERVLSARFEVGRDVAAALSAVVLLKGVPTVITSPDGRRLVSASGTPALATGGSGDVLSGVAGTLLAQLSDPFVAAAAAAWVHGRAAERVPSSNTGDARGITLDDVIGELRDAWTFDARPSRYPVLAELPALGARR